MPTRRLQRPALDQTLARRLVDLPHRSQGIVTVTSSIKWARAHLDGCKPLSERSHLLVDGFGRGPRHTVAGAAHEDVPAGGPARRPVACAQATHTQRTLSAHSAQQRRRRQRGPGGRGKIAKSVCSQPRARLPCSGGRMRRLTGSGSHQPHRSRSLASKCASECSLDHCLGGLRAGGRTTLGAQAVDALRVEQVHKALHTQAPPQVSRRPCTLAPQATGPFEARGVAGGARTIRRHPARNPPPGT